MDQHQDKRVFCFGDWWTLSTVSEMSKIGPRPLLDTKIRLDGGCYVLSCLGMKWPYMYIYIQLDRIPMTAMYIGRAAIGQLWIKLYEWYAVV